MPGKHSFVVKPDRYETPDAFSWQAVARAVCLAGTDIVTRVGTRTKPRKCGKGGKGCFRD
jgi:hypothetical protein